MTRFPNTTPRRQLRSRTNNRKCLFEPLEDRQLLTSTPGLPWLETADLAGLGDFEAGDNAGYAVAISGDTIVISSNGDGDLAVDAGAAYVYIRNDAGTPEPDDDTWMQQAKLFGHDTTTQDQFGSYVDIQNDTIVVGANQFNAGPGAAYVFQRGGTTWTEVAKLTASDGADYDRFGGRVTIDGDTIVIGALADDVDGNGAGSADGEGSAYVFVEPVGGWSGNLTETAKLTASDGAARFRFGRAVDVLGDTVLIGADHRDVAGNGSAYIFQRDDNSTPSNPTDDTWAETAILYASDGLPGDQFGNQVALDGSRAVITAHRADHSGVVDAGSAYVFERQDNGTPLNPSDDAWLEVSKLQASDPGTSDELGRGLDIEGDTIVVGAWSGEIEIANSGSVYFFERQNDGTWIEKGEVTASDAESNEGCNCTVNAFGAGKIDLQGDTLVVGDYAHASNRGGAFVFAKSDSMIVASELFESGSFSGGLGDWSAGGWTVAGDANIRTDSDPHSGNYHARLRRNTGDLQRIVDVSDLTDVKLRFWSKLSSFEGSDQAHVQVSGDGSSWTTLTTFVNGQDDNQYHFHEFDVPDLGDTVHIRFDAEMNRRQDIWYIDDVEITGVDAPVGPSTLAINDVQVTEGDGSDVFTVTLSAPSSLSVTVDYDTADNSAVAGNDYTTTSGTLTFAPGVTTQTILVPIVDDL